MYENYANECMCLILIQFTLITLYFSLIARRWVGFGHSDSPELYLFTRGFGSWCNVVGPIHCGLTSRYSTYVDNQISRNAQSANADARGLSSRTDAQTRLYVLFCAG